MCLLLASKKGNAIPKESLEIGDKSNSHGAGFAFAKNGKLFVEKGFFVFEEFYKAYQKCIGFPHITHQRYATSGEKNKDNCHPFVVSTDENNEADLVVAHNGVIHHFSHKNQNMSDTFSFTKEILTPLAEDCNDKNWFKNSGIKYLIENAIGSGNKLALIDNIGYIEIFNQDSGEWLNEEDQIWASNGSYHTPKQRNNGGFGYTQQAWNEYESDYWSGANNAAASEKTGTSVSTPTVNIFDINQEELDEVDDYLEELNNITIGGS